MSADPVASEFMLPEELTKSNKRPQPRSDNAKTDTRSAFDLVVVILALTTPTVLVIVAGIGPATLLAAAQFGAIIMRAWLRGRRQS